MSIEKMAMPQLGESVTEGTISQWLVAEGDQVNKYDPIAEVTTDKVNAEVPSSFTGTIQKLIAAEGDTLDVGDAICTIEVDGEAEKKQPLESSEDHEAPVPAAEGTREAGGRTMKKRYSPAVLRLSQENDIDLDQLNGTGMDGRITRKDVLKFIDEGKKAPKQADRKTSKSEPAPAAECFSDAVAHGTKLSEIFASAETEDTIVPLTGVRRAIATNMLRSKHEIPHGWMMVEVDVTNLVHYRNQIKQAFKQKEGYNLTYLPFFIKAIVASLKEFPRINATWADDKIIEKKAVNISLAVATDEALYVPVIKAADEKSIKGIAQSIRDLVLKTRENRLSPDDMHGGTFTVNNTGSFGSIQSQPIINYPQAAILSVESIVKRPVVINNMIAIRDMVNLCMSIDHRVLDGLVTGRFLASVKERLENTSAENTPIY